MKLHTVKDLTNTFNKKFLQQTSKSQKHYNISSTVSKSSQTGKCNAF